MGPNVEWQSHKEHIGHTLKVSLIPATEFHPERIRVTCETCNGLIWSEIESPEEQVRQPFKPYPKSQSTRR